jgi:hypothetical protein
MPKKTNSDQLHGTLDMLVLKTLQTGALHGYAIALRLEQLSNDVLNVEEGSLYPALYRMERRGFDHMPMNTSVTKTVRTSDATSKGLAFRQILPGYLQAMNQRVLEGRPLQASDRSGDVVTGVLLNRAGAKALFGDEPAMGRTVMLGTDRVPADVVGIVADLRHMGPLRPTLPEIYVPFAPAASGWERSLGLTVVIRPRARTSISADAIGEVARSIGPPVVVDRIRSGSDWYGDSITLPRQRTVLLSLLGSLGLLLALVGIFGMTAYAVARRTREIGVRMAFGARPRDVVRQMIGEAVWPIVLGTVVGLGVAAVATSVIASFLFETAPTDPATFAAVAVVLASAGLIAAWIPARRAARVDPVVALRAE